jgi:seryl-tRNA synthetase
MIDIKILRNNPELIRESITLRNLKIDLDALIALDAERLSKRQALEELQTLRNRVSKEIPTITDAPLRTAKITEMK